MSRVLTRFWVTSMELPHASVILYVLMVVSVQPTSEGVPSLTKATIGVPQLSASSVTTAMSGAGNVPLQPAKIIGAGFDAVGEALSRVLMRF